MTILEKQIQKTIVFPVEATKPINLNLKNPVFKPYQITKTSQNQFQKNKNDFLKLIKDLLNHLEASSSTLISHDTSRVSKNPHTSISHINTIQNYQTQNL